MKAFLLFFVGIVSLFSYAQDGSLDTSFGDNGVVFTDLNNSHDLGWSVVQQADQKLIVSGITSSDTNSWHPYLVRYMPDGSLDTTFGIDGKITADYGIGFNGYKYLFIDNQQNIVAAGNMGYDGNFVIAKYLENGNLDNSFGNNGVLTITDGNYSGMVLLDDGSILLLKFSGSDEIIIKHYLANGVLDTNFGINGVATSTFSGESFESREIKVDAGNNIFIVGKRDNTDTADIILMKFLPTGYLDVSFGNNGMAIKTLNAILFPSDSSVTFDFTNDDKIVIAGSYGGCIDIGNPSFQPFFMRFLNSGLPDDAFGNNGTVLLPISSFYISQLIIQENQRMIVSGNYPDCFEGGIYGINRYFSGGAQDNSFNGESIEFDNYKTILQQDGKIVSVGNTFWYDGQEDVVLVRHNNTTLSLPDYENQKTSIYPNPSKGIFIVENNFYSENVFYQITDIIGKIIVTGELSDKQTQIDLSSTQSGVYFLKTSNQVFQLLKN